MSTGSGHWKLRYYDGHASHVLENIKSNLTKKVKYDYKDVTTLDGNRHPIRAWKYLIYTIIIEGYTKAQWDNIYSVMDGTTVNFYEHTDNNNPVDCMIESVMPIYENDQINKPKLKVVISTKNPTIETLVSPTGIDTQALPELDQAFGSDTWMVYIDGDDYDSAGSWNLAKFSFNKPSQIINKSVLTGERWLTRKGTYSQHKIVIKEPATAIVEALLKNVGSVVNFTPFVDNISFNEDMILKDVKYYNPEGQYLKNSIEFTLKSKGFGNMKTK